MGSELAILDDSLANQRVPVREEVGIDMTERWNQQIGIRFASGCPSATLLQPKHDGGSTWWT